MIEIAIPGWKELHLQYLVLDLNGTLSCDGQLLGGARERLIALAARLRIHVLTADTFGQAQGELAGLPCEVTILPQGRGDLAKREFVRQLGPEQVVAIGNGRNDRLMLEEAVLGMAVVLREGAAAETLRAADIVLSNIDDALDLLAHPLRLVATLRS
jgi:soluble P-type ATPase